MLALLFTFLFCCFAWVQTSLCMSAIAWRLNNSGRGPYLQLHSSTILYHSISDRSESTDDLPGDCAIEWDSPLRWHSLAKPMATSYTDSPLASSYIYRHVKPIYVDLWERLCPTWTVDRFSKRIPSSMSPSQVDVFGTWTPNDDPDEVAKNLLRQCDSTPMTEEHIRLLAANLSESLRGFRDFCQEHVLPSRAQFPDTFCVRFKYRLIATRGRSGTKCPLYHVDHVPVRWIETFVGPGVDVVVGDVGVRWNAFHSDDQDDFELSLTDEERNGLRVDASVADVYFAQPGEAVLMIGNEFSGDEEGLVPPSSVRVVPVVHKSPQIREGQPRVRFTQDIAFH